MLPLVINLADDIVPNVRFNVAKTLEFIFSHLTNVGKGLVTQCLKKLQNDSDNDVRYYASNALLHTSALNEWEFSCFSGIIHISVNVTTSLNNMFFLSFHLSPHDKNKDLSLHICDHHLFNWFQTYIFVDIWRNNSSSARRISKSSTENQNKWPILICTSGYEAGFTVMTI